MDSEESKPGTARGGLSGEDRGLSQDDEISLLDLLIVVAKHKLTIAAITIGAAVLSVIYALALPNIYTGTATVLPPQQGQSAAAMMAGQLGLLTGVAGSALGIKNPNDLYVGILKSRTIADKLIARFNLQALYKTDTIAATRGILSGNSSITSGKDGLITIEFDSEDPKLAAVVANAYIEELDKLTQSLAVTEAAQRRLFFERQLERAKEDLRKAEIAARSALETGGVAMVDEQGKSMIEAIAGLRARITTKEVEISAARGFATEQNPQVVKARQELAALKHQLAKLEGTGNEAGSAGAAKHAGAGFKNLALLREVKYNEILFEMLVKQLELAKIDEAKDAGIVQVVDQAVIPDRKSKPKRSTIVIIATLAGGFCALLWAFVREAKERAKQDPAQAARLAALRHYASFHRKRAK